MSSISAIPLWKMMLAKVVVANLWKIDMPNKKEITWTEKVAYVLKKATLDESSLLLAPHRTMMNGVIMPLSKQPLTHERVVNEWGTGEISSKRAIGGDWTLTCLAIALFTREFGFANWELLLIYCADEPLIDKRSFIWFVELNCLGFFCWVYSIS